MDSSTWMSKENKAGLLTNVNICKYLQMSAGIVTDNMAVCFEEG